MRTIIHAGVLPAYDRLRLFRLGQAAAVALAKVDRDALLGSISNALARGKAVDDYIATHGAVDPSLENVLGADAERFWDISADIASIFPLVEALLNRLRDPEPDAWIWPTDAETDAVEVWSAGIDEMIEIINRHPAPLPRVESPPVPRRPEEPTILGISQGTVLVGSAVAVGISAIIYAVAS